MIMRLALLAALAVTIFNIRASAQVRFSEKDNELRIAGPIDTQTRILIESMRDILIDYSPRVVLDSIGGDVESAIEIGKIIRDLELWTEVKKNSRCYSSCALIFVSGVNRYNLGEIGLHRPYAYMNNISTIPTIEQIRTVYSKVKDYIQFMNVDDQFFRIMMETPPESMKIYRNIEITSLDVNPNEAWYRLVPNTDPAYEEITTIRRARRYKLDTVTYRQKASEAERHCFRSKDSSLDCQYARIWGLNVNDYKARRAKAESNCAMTSAEEKILLKLKKVDRYIHPAWIRVEDCEFRTIKGL